MNPGDISGTLAGPDSVLRITMESPDSRVRAGQGPKNASWEYEYRNRAIFIDHVALAKQGDNRIGSVRLSVRLHALSCLNYLTYDLGFWYGGRP